jgi:hypothetical protein
MTPTEKAQVITDLSVLEQRVLALIRSMRSESVRGQEFLIPGKLQSATGRMSSEPQYQELPK